MNTYWLIGHKNYSVQNDSLVCHWNPSMARKKKAAAAAAAAAESEASVSNVSSFPPRGGAVASLKAPNQLVFSNKCPFVPVIRHSPEPQWEGHHPCLPALIWQARPQCGGGSGSGGAPSGASCQLGVKRGEIGFHWLYVTCLFVPVFPNYKVENKKKCVHFLQRCRNLLLWCSSRVGSWTFYLFLLALVKKPVRPISHAAFM